MSDIDTKAFFDAVLKTIACTRNHNPDEQGYASGVQAPAARIRELESELGDRAITRAEADQVLEWLETTFRTKQTPEEEREYYRGYIAEAAGLSAASAAPVVVSG